MAEIPCSKCGLKDETEFYMHNRTRCKACVRATVSACKAIKKQERARIREGLAQKERESPSSYLCPICREPCVGGQGLLIHFKERHRIEDGKHAGLVLGLDVIPCMICGTHVRKTLYPHLRAKHGLDSRGYFNQFPHALISIMDARDLELGHVRWTVPQRNARETRVKADQATSVKAPRQTCPVCLTEHRELTAHYARKHPELARVPVFEAYSANKVGENDQELLVGSILALRPKVDVERGWIKGESRVYFIQAGGPNGPIKIGVSAQVLDRIWMIQVGCPARLRVLATTPGKPEDEAQLHRMFAPFQTSGEWFKAHPLLLQYIAGMCRQQMGVREEATFETIKDNPQQYEPVSEAVRFQQTLKFIEHQLALDSKVEAEVLLSRAKIQLGESGFYGDRNFFTLWVERIRSPKGRGSKNGLVFVGDVFGHLTVIAFDGVTEDPKKHRVVGGRVLRSRYWRCKCVCGTESVWSTSDLRRGVRRSCGCMSNNRPKFAKGNCWGASSHAK